MQKLKAGKPSALGDFTPVFDETFFVSTFGMGNVNTKTFLLMLAQKNPLSFVSGAPVDLAKTLKESNRTEFHHLMPKDFLKQSGQSDFGDTMLANMCFMSRSDNRHLGGVAPSEYRKKMGPNVDSILEHAVCPKTLFDDKYEDFFVERATMLMKMAKSLCQIK